MKEKKETYKESGCFHLGMILLYVFLFFAVIFVFAIIDNAFEEMGTKISDGEYGNLILAFVYTFAFMMPAAVIMTIKSIRRKKAGYVPKHSNIHFTNSTDKPSPNPAPPAPKNAEVIKNTPTGFTQLKQPPQISPDTTTPASGFSVNYNNNLTDPPVIPPSPPDQIPVTPGSKPLSGYPAGKNDLDQIPIAGPLEPKN